MKEKKILTEPYLFNAQWIIGLLIRFQWGEGFSHTACSFIYCKCDPCRPLEPLDQKLALLKFSQNTKVR